MRLADCTDVPSARIYENCKNADEWYGRASGTYLRKTIKMQSNGTAQKASNIIRPYLINYE